MKLLSFVQSGALRIGILTDAGVIAIPQHVGQDMVGVIANWADVQATARALVADRRQDALDFNDLELAPVVTGCGKVICLGMNFAKEGVEKPSFPLSFLRAPSSLTGHGAAIAATHMSSQIDYEGELAVVIGRGGRDIAAAQALDYVFGYTVFNDVSLRDLQKHSTQWTIGKNVDGTGAIGPVIVTAEQLPPGGAGLAITTRLNGEIVQRGNTSEMMFGVAETIAYLSRFMALTPGDVIAMGTPAGIGMLRQPPLWMQAGDRVDVEIEGIGMLSNCIA